MGLLVREQHYQQFLIYSSLYAFSIPEKRTTETQRVTKRSMGSH